MSFSAEDERRIRKYTLILGLPPGFAIMAILRHWVGIDLSGWIGSLIEGFIFASIAAITRKCVEHWVRRHPAPLIPATELPKQIDRAMPDPPERAYRAPHDPLEAAWRSYDPTNAARARFGRGGGLGG